MRFDLLLPDLDKVRELLFSQYNLYLANWWATFSVSFLGSILALSCALIISVLAVKFRIVDVVMEPVVAISQSFPLQAIAPLIIIAFGITFSTKAFIAFLIAFFPIYGACVTAIRIIPKNLLCFSRIYNTNYIKEVYYVRIPYALPTIISSAKVGFTLAVLGAVVAEFMIPTNGLGRMILIAQSQFNIESLYICIMLLIFQGLLMFVSLSKIEKYFIKKGGYKNE